MATSTFNPVLGWDQRVLAVLESTFGTVPSPASSQYIEIVTMDMGALEAQDIRAKKDKSQGRGNTNGYVQGRVKPIAWGGELSVKTRTAHDSVPKEDPFYQAAGFLQTVNTGVSVQYNLGSLPGTTPSLSIYSALGQTPYFAEQGFGGIVEDITWTGGDAELMMKLSGAFQGKFEMGQASATVADGTTTTITVDNPGDEYKLNLGWFQWESEIIQITAVQYGSNTFTCLRAQLTTAGVAHTAKNLVPWQGVPANTGLTPITEAVGTVSFNSVQTRCTKFQIQFKTGAKHLPGESGSKRVQGMYFGRYSLKAEITLVLTDDAVRYFGKTANLVNEPVTIAWGTGTGGVVTFNIPHSVMKPWKTPAPHDTNTEIKIELDGQDFNGNDMFNFVLT